MGTEWSLEADPCSPFEQLQSHNPGQELPAQGLQIPLDLFQSGLWMFLHPAVDFFP